MELEEMKNLWQQYDRSLQENKILNERIVSSMLKDKSGNIIRRIVNWEYAGVAICIAMLLFFTGTAWMHYTTALWICYIYSLLIVITSLVFGIYKINYLSHTDITRPVTETTKRLQVFRLLVAKEKIYTLILMPVFIFTMTAVVSYWLFEINIFNHISSYLPKIIAGLVIALVATPVFYRRFYFESIRKVADNLRELKEFTETDR